MQADGSRRRAAAVAVAWVASVVMAALLGWWAAREASDPPTVAPAQTQTVTVTATEGSVSDVVPVGVQVSWPASATFVSGGAGTITSIDLEPGSEVRSGDVVLTVDLEPVVVGEGQVPAFRELGPGVSGADVRQLKDLLVAGQVMAAAEGDVFDDDTAEAVRRWQEGLGVPPTGTVEPGALVFVSGLPRQMLVVGEVQVGSRMAPGQPLLATAVGEPRMTMVVGADRTDVLQPGVAVVIDVDGEPLTVQIGRLETDPATDQTVAVLVGQDGGSVCGTGCAGLVEVGGQRVLPAEAVVVPEVSGTVIPAAAVVTGADGRPAVRTGDGELVEVQVLATSRGQSVVEGIGPGQAVQLARGPVSTDG